MKSRYKSIDVSHEEDREKILIMFKEARMTDAKWLNYQEAIKLHKDMGDVLKEYSKGINEKHQK